MLVVLSPAKKLNENHPVKENATVPQFVDEAEKLINNLKKYSPKKLSKLMGLSDNLSELNVERYQEWQKEHNEKNAKTAGLLFDGEVYSGLAADKFTKAQLSYAQNNLRILSGLYGLLKPLDLVHPYRLEMGTKLKIGRKNNLYEFWGDKIAETLNDEMTDDELFINLASSEYFKAVNQKVLKVPMITPVFKDFKNGQYKTIMTFAKKARGLMVRYIIDNSIKDLDGIKTFNTEGYAFDTNMSTETELVFTR